MLQTTKKNNIGKKKSHKSIIKYRQQKDKDIIPLKYSCEIIINDSLRRNHTKYVWGELVEKIETPQNYAVMIYHKVDIHDGSSILLRD